MSRVDHHVQEQPERRAWRRRSWTEQLPWLLEPSSPAVRHVALRDPVDRPPDDADLATARAAAMVDGPIAAIPAAQHPDGYWEKPGPGYATKYRGTVWQVIFLDQLGADPADERIRRARGADRGRRSAAT